MASRKTGVKVDLQGRRGMGDKGGAQLLSKILLENARTSSAHAWRFHESLRETRSPELGGAASDCGQCLRLSSPSL